MPPFRSVMPAINSRVSPLQEKKEFLLRSTRKGAPTSGRTGSACYIMEDWECMLYHGRLGVQRQECSYDIRSVQGS